MHHHIAIDGIAIDGSATYLSTVERLIMA